MAQDIISDALNKIWNAVKAGHSEVEIARHSKLLLLILAIAKLKGNIKSYKIENSILKVEIGRLNKCQAIKPRFIVSVDKIEKYVPRYLPARDIGFIILSTSQGLMTHATALDKNIGGCLIAYFY